MVLNVFIPIFDKKTAMQFSDLDLSKTYTYADYFKWKLEERVELLLGRVFKMSPAPNVLHQKYSTYIQGELYIHLRGKKCRLFSAPFDVRLPHNSKDDKDIITVLQPDLCVICDDTKLDDRGCIGAPDIVVEITALGNNAKELKNKYKIYEEAAVKEYWVVYPQNQSFIVYILQDGRYVSLPPMVSGDEVTSLLLPGFALRLNKMFDNYSSDQEPVCPNN